MSLALAEGPHAISQYDLIDALRSMEAAIRQLGPDNIDDPTESDGDVEDVGDVDSATESTGVGSVDEGHSSPSPGSQ